MSIFLASRFFSVVVGDTPSFQSSHFRNCTVWYNFCDTPIGCNRNISFYRYANLANLPEGDNLEGVTVRKSAISVILLLILVLIISTIGCGGKTEEIQTFSKHGFSLEYPKGFRIVEEGLDDAEANENSGIVHVLDTWGYIRTFDIAWRKMLQSFYEAEGHREENMEAWVEVLMAAQNIESIDRGEQAETIKAGHQILYQYHVITATSAKICGIRATFYCNESQREFILQTMYQPCIAKEDVTEDLMNLLDSFVCH